MNWLDERGNFKEKKMKDCPKCEGTGFIHECPYCDKRLFFGVEEIINCPNCLKKIGEVESRLDCTHCGGEGKVEVDFFGEVDRAYDEIKHSQT